MDSVLNNQKRFEIIKRVNDFYYKVRDYNDKLRQKDLYLTEFSLDKYKKLKSLSNIYHNHLFKLDIIKLHDYIILIEEGSTSNDLIERSCFNYIPTISNNVIVFEDRIIICLYQLISAVNYLHQNGIIHKRIGKGWISFVEWDAKLSINRDCTILTNFKLDKIDSIKIIVKRKDINYNAPEFELDNQICTKYDIWCLGWYLFHICTFQNPFDILNRVSNFKNWNKVSMSGLTFKTDLINLFQKMTHIDPDMRPSAQELLDAPIFIRFRIHFEKSKFNNRYIRLNESDKLSFSFKASDSYDNFNIKLLKRYLKSDPNIKFLLTNFKGLNIYYLNWIEDTFKEDIFYYSVEPLLETTLIQKLNELHSSNKQDIIIETVKVWFVKLLLALDALHKNKIIHKNISPNLIGFDKENEIKLSFSHNSTSVENLNEMILVYGHDYSYFCPEIQLYNNVNHKYDTWCLGWTLYFMMTQSNHIDEYKKIGFTSYTPIDLPNMCGKFFNEIFHKMIRKDFMDRPSVEQLLDYEIFNLIIKEKFDECGFSFNSKIVKEKKLTIFEIDKIKHNTKLSQSETEETQPKKKLTKQESVTYYTYEESFNPGVIDYGNDAAEVIDSFD